MGGYFSPAGGFAPTSDPLQQLITSGMNLLGQVITTRGSRPGVPSPGQLSGSGGMPQLTSAPPDLTALGATYGIQEKRKYRRMNVLNPRALRRSMRRVRGFARFARKTISFTRKVKMKKGRR